MTVAEVLTPLIGAINLDQLRLGSPRRFIFFCGGKIQPAKSRVISLRDYLLRELTDHNPIADTTIVCAESATSLFRDSPYVDLIAFEEDIAQISDVILVIGESAGSLTELGAFSMNAAIAPRLKIFVRDDHYNQESFIKLGPLRHLERTISEASVSSYPWRVNGEEKLILSSAKPHLNAMREDLIERIAAIHKTEIYRRDNSKRQLMILIFWMVYILRAALLSEIVDVLAKFGIQEKPNEVKKYLYCMRVAEWVDEKKYGHQVYYFLRVDHDPFEYAFNDDVKIREPIRWKSDIADQIIKQKLSRPKAILELVGK